VSESAVELRVDGRRFESRRRLPRAKPKGLAGEFFGQTIAGKMPALPPLLGIIPVEAETKSRPSLIANVVRNPG
jgi:hypothetical protein